MIGRSRAKFAASLLLTILIVTSLLLLPAPASAVSVAVNTSDADGTEASVPYYLLGGTVKLLSSISFSISESIPISKVTLDIQGPQPRTIDLPWDEGAFSFSFPHTVPSGNTTETLSGTVARTNVGWDGYGYGYANPGGAQATISYTINWKPPLLKDPPPPQPPPSLPGYIDAWPNPVVPGNLPVRGLAYNSSNSTLYVLVQGPIYSVPGIPDGTPQDAILQVDPNDGTLLGAFVTPGNNMEALEYFQNSLYVAQDTGYPSQLYRLNPANGAVISGWPKTIPEPLGGLANDGTNLLGGTRSNNQLYTINPNDGSVVGSPWYLYEPFGGPPLPPSEGLTYYAQDNNLLWASMGEIWRIDMAGSPPAVQGKEMLQPVIEVYGLAMTDGTVHMGGWDFTQNKIYKAKHPNSPPPESTVAGDYTATLTLTTNSTTYDSTPVSFKLKKIDSVVVTITSPSDQFASQTSSITVTGTVNDPTISQVTVGSGAGLAEFIKDNVETVDVPSGVTTQDLWQPSGLWRVANDRALAKISEGFHSETQGTGNQSWAYNQPSPWGPMPNYDTPGQINSGFLESTNTYSVGGKSKFTFWTAWNTEPDPTWDNKLVEVFVDGSWQSVAQIVEWGPGLPPPPPPPIPPWIPGPGLPPWGVLESPMVVDLSDPDSPSVPKSDAGVPLVQVPQFTWQQVVLDFGERYKDKNIKIRFKFDTGDPWANEMEGWYIDRIGFKGESLVGEVVSVVNGAFSTPFTLGEGTNIIVVTAQSAYPPNLIGTAQVSGEVDTTAPVISFDAYSAVSGQAQVTISGTVTEANPDTLTMTQTTSGGTKPQVAPDSYDTQTGAFSTSVILSSGDNTFTFTATDKAGWSAQDSIVINYDVIGPTITARSTLYPVGEVSARTGDFFIFQVDASDAQSGMDRVQMLLPDPDPNLTEGWTSAQIAALDAGNEVTITSGTTSITYQKISGTVYRLDDFKKATEIPQAVRTQWGVSGTVTDRYLFPMNLPSSAPPGTYSLTARAKDKGGNTSTASVSATVVSTLSAFNIYLMPGPDPNTPSVPGWNLISTPLIPNDTNIDTVFSGLDAQGLMSVWYYDTVTSTWQSYDPDPNVPDSLTAFTTGKGYWVKMDTAQFTYDDPMATGLPQTPRPVKLTIYGQVLRPGEVPPTYPIKAGWNLIGLHSERSKQVSTALRSLVSTFGASKWGSLLQYKNFISYPTKPGEEPETVLGSFESLGSTDTMNAGVGFWLFAMEDGTIVP